MGQASGFLRELRHRVKDEVHYEISIDSASTSLYGELGRTVKISHSGEKACVHCGRRVKKLYQNGYCFPCVTSLAQCDLCIVKPHECHFQQGTCRDEQFAQEHCMIPHYVYLALSSHVKVGLTRKGRQLTRWVDQGAVAAILVAEVRTRKEAGELEVEIGTFMSDKTDWRKMLIGNVPTDINLLELKEEMVHRVSPQWEPYFLKDENTVYEFVYPREAGFVPKLTSLSLDKTPVVEGVLRGIKGQYLLFDHGVFNVKKHAGFQVELSLSNL